ncbi:helix-turn-helix domain-containing protein [Nocardioides sp. GXZ039]|uniref:helix-turn-helix domain-containing protein n=1 Tax=Nocardioides sp. GXZ039 TaxID=3136018 RepID=UPI0030F491DA
MPTRRSATPAPTSTGAGILRPGELARHATVERVACAPGIAHWVENHWVLRWDLPDDAVFSSQTLPHPACTLSLELGQPRRGVGADRVVVTGVVTRRFDVELSRSGWVLGVKFRPGGLATLADVDAATLADRTVPAGELLPAHVVDVLRDIPAGTPVAAAAEAADAAVAALVTDAPDADYDLVLAVVADMLADRSLLRVSDVVERHAILRRRLERLFARYVGVAPKWVLARYRMHDVVAALDDGYDGSLADLAAAHGWYDQAHFGRDFTALVGLPPSRYRAESAAR